MFFHSDIVFCRTWCGVDVPKLYNPVTSLLSPGNQKMKWLGMRTMGQLKSENNLKNNPQLDSLYTVKLNFEIIIYQVRIRTVFSV